MKFITVRIDEKLKRIEKRKKAREKRAARKPAPPPACACVCVTGVAGPKPAPSGAPPAPGMPHRRLCADARAPQTEAAARKPEGRRYNHMAEQRGGRPIAASQRPTGGDKAIATGKKQYFRRKKVCRFCVEKIDDINYKDVEAARQLHLRARQDYSAPHFRRLYAAPEAVERSDQAGAQHRPDAVRVAHVREENDHGSHS